MWLTKNDKKVLRILIKKPSLSDKAISRELHLSSQAIGKIKQKLEREGLITHKELHLDMFKLGMKNLCMIEAISLESEIDETHIINSVKEIPEIVCAIKSTRKNSSYIFIVFIKEVSECEELRNKIKNKNGKKIFNFEHVEYFPLQNLIKKDYSGLYLDLINKK